MSGFAWAVIGVAVLGLVSYSNGGESIAVIATFAFVGIGIMIIVKGLSGN